MAYPARHPSERFWDKVDKRTDADCWEWRGARHPTGYGFMYAGPAHASQARWIKAHRLSWEIHHGEIPDGVLVLHHCDNPPCVNPAHLYLGTHADNARDRAVRRRGKEQRQHGEANDNARLTEDQVLAIDAAYRAGITQTELARLFGCSQPQISRIVRHENWVHLWGERDAR